MVIAEAFAPDGRVELRHTTRVGATQPAWFRLDARDAEGRIVAVTNPIFTGPHPQPALVTCGDFVAGLT